MSPWTAVGIVMLLLSAGNGTAAVKTTKRDGTPMTEKDVRAQERARERWARKSLEERQAISSRSNKLRRERMKNMSEDEKVACRQNDTIRMRKYRSKQDPELTRAKQRISYALRDDEIVARTKELRQMRTERTNGSPQLLAKQDLQQELRRHRAKQVRAGLDESEYTRLCEATIEAVKAQGHLPPAEVDRYAEQTMLQYKPKVPTSGEKRDTEIEGGKNPALEQYWRQMYSYAMQGGTGLSEVPLAHLPSTVGQSSSGKRPGSSSVTATHNLYKTSSIATGLVVPSSSQTADGHLQAHVRERTDAMKEFSCRASAKYRQNPANQAKIRKWQAIGQRNCREKKLNELVAKVGGRKEASIQIERERYAQRVKYERSLPPEVQKQRAEKRAADQRRMYLKRKERKQAEARNSQVEDGAD